MIRSLRLHIITIILCISPLPMFADDDWVITAANINDSLSVTLVAKDTKQQLAVLMQGLQVSIPSQNLSIMFPSAPMVRDKMKHHPNEVKATMRKDSTNVEVKPDLQPLIKALCDTSAVVIDSINNVHSTTHNFAINLDKENTTISFSFSIPSVEFDSDTIEIHVMSIPGNLSTRREFTGKRLSKEESPSRNGLGEASMGKDDKNRIVNFTETVIIKRPQKT